MKPQFRVTYEIITHESAEHGDAAERGYVEPGQWHYQTLADASPDGLTLREAAGLCDCLEDSGRWFTEQGERCNYRTGAVEVRSLHPPANITPSSYARLSRVLGVRSF